MTKVLRYAGFAEEATYNPSSPPEAQFHVDITEGGLDSPSDTQIIYEGGLSRGRHTHRPGFYSPSGGISWAADVRTVVHALKWALGGYAFTADEPEVGTNLHEAWASDDRLLNSFTARLGKDIFEHVFSGCIVNSLSLEVSDGYTMITLDTNAAKDSKSALKEVPDLLLPDEFPLTFPDTSISIAQGDVSAAVRSLTLSFDNSADASQGRGLGSRHPYRIPVNARTSSLSLGLWYENTDHLERFWGATGGPAEGGTPDVQSTITLDAGADGSVEILLPRVLYSEVGISGSGRGEIEQSVTAQLMTENVMLNDGITEVATEMLASVHNDHPEVSA